MNPHRTFNASSARDHGQTVRIGRTIRRTTHAIRGNHTRHKKGTPEHLAFMIPLLASDFGIVNSERKVRTYFKASLCPQHKRNLRGDCVHIGFVVDLDQFGTDGFFVKFPGERQIYPITGLPRISAPGVETSPTGNWAPTRADIISNTEVPEVESSSDSESV